MKRLTHCALPGGLLALCLLCGTALLGCGGNDQPQSGEMGADAMAFDATSASGPAIVPQPKSLRWRSGSFAPTDPSLEIVLLTTHSQAERTVAEALQARLTATHGVRPPITTARRPGGPQQIAFRRPTAYELSTTPALAEPEGYLLKVHDNRILLIASQPSGRYYAAQSLRQLIFTGRDIRCVKVADYPDLPFRALHIYVNRYMYPDIRLYEGLIDAAARLKYNAVILMFYGTIHLDQHPEWVDGGAYTKAEIAPLVDQGLAEGLDMIPEAKSWGHADGTADRSRNTIIEYDPDLSRLFIPVTRPGYAPRTFVTTRYGVKRILFDTYDELIALFQRPRYFHLGCDEAWGATTSDDELPYPSDQLTADYLTALADHVRRKGCRPMMWADMLLEEAAWQHVGGGHSFPPRYTHTAIDALPKDILMLDWHYEPLPIAPHTQDRYDSLAYFRSHGFDVAGTCFGYFGLDNISQMGRDVSDFGGCGLVQSTWRRLKSIPQCVPMGADAAWNPGQVDLNNLPYYPIVVMNQIMGEHCGSGWRSMLAEERYPGDT